MSSAWVALVLSAGIVLAGLCVGEQPSRCCFDKEFSVTIGTVGEVLADDPDSALFIDGMVQMGYDYYRDREGIIVLLRKIDGTYTTQYQLKDYAARRMYASVDNSSCFFYDLPAYDVMREPCIPANAVFEGTSEFGYGQHTMRVNTWSFTRAFSAHNDSTVTLSVTQDHCVPVTETIIGPYGSSPTPVEQSLFFTGYHPGIDNLKDLEIPLNCQPGHPL